MCWRHIILLQWPPARRPHIESAADCTRGTLCRDNFIWQTKRDVLIFYFILLLLLSFASLVDVPFFWSRRTCLLHLERVCDKSLWSSEVQTIPGCLYTYRRNNILYRNYYDAAVVYDRICARRLSVKTTSVFYLILYYIILFNITPAWLLATITIDFFFLNQCYYQLIISREFVQ